jgi:hypothetical protein
MSALGRPDTMVNILNLGFRGARRRPSAFNEVNAFLQPGTKPQTLHRMTY